MNQLNTVQLKFILNRGKNFTICHFEINLLQYKKFVDFLAKATVYCLFCQGESPFFAFYLF